VIYIERKHFPSEIEKEEALDWLLNDISVGTDITNKIRYIKFIKGDVDESVNISTKIVADLMAAYHNYKMSLEFKDTSLGRKFKE
jgi:hypothetical protein